MAQLLTTRDGAVGRIVFSNPAKFNAMSADMWRALPPAIRAFDDDPAIRVVVLEGEGDKAFVSGADISQFESNRTSEDAQREYGRAVEAAYLAPVNCSKPVIAKIRGICMGGGLGLAAACDLRFCSSDARFRMPAARLGLGYNVPGVKRFLDIIGVQNTFDLFFSARVFGAEEALRMGFVGRVASPDGLDADAAAFTSMVAENAPLTLRALKLTVNTLLTDPSKRDDAAIERALSACMASDDYREGARAFMEKRKPDFKGR